MRVQPDPVSPENASLSPARPRRDAAPAATPMHDAGPGARADLLLALTPEVGPVLGQRLKEHFGSAERVLAASHAALREVRGVGPKIADRIVQAERLIDLDAQWEVVRRHRLTVLLPGQPAFPHLLSELPDPPGVLFVRGQLLPVDALAVAIVGSRRATRYGLLQAERLAGALARTGITVVSGMARGVDAAAHRGALAAGGRTVAVLAGGVLKPYPPEHAELATHIAASGAVLSEALPAASPLRGMFPQRNRLISGLSLGVVVVEAADRSGALITVRHAVEQDREVFAVPGQIDNPLAAGPHRLIRDGAKLTACVDDILEELGPLAVPADLPDGRTLRSPAELQLDPVERQVLQAVDAAGTHVDCLARQCDLPISRVLAVVTVLESRRLVRKLGGSRVARSCP